MKKLACIIFGCKWQPLELSEYSIEEILSFLETYGRVTYCERCEKHRLPKKYKTCDKCEDCICSKCKIKLTHKEIYWCLIMSSQKDPYQTSEEFMCSNCDIEWRIKEKQNV